MSTPTTVKVVLLGNSGVGKSSLALRFTSDAFADENEPTLGAAFMSRTISLYDRKVKLNIWDTAGQERYRSMARMYYQDAQAAILVYDLTSKASFTELKNWYKELRENAPSQLGNDYTVTAVVGNKEDMASGESADTREARKWAESIGAVYWKTSAKTKNGVDGLFNDIANKGDFSLSGRANGVKLGGVEHHKAGCRC